MGAKKKLFDKWMAAILSAAAFLIPAAAFCQNYSGEVNTAIATIGSATITGPVLIVTGTSTLNGQIIVAGTATVIGSAFSVGTSTFTVARGRVGIGTTNPQHALEVDGGLFSRRYSLTDGAAIAVDWQNGNVQSVTLGASGRTLSFANGQDGGRYILLLKQGGAGSNTVNWPAGVRWPWGIAPTLTKTTGKTDYFGFVYNGVDAKFDCVTITLNL